MMIKPFFFFKIFFWGVCLLKGGEERGAAWAQESEFLPYFRESASVSGAFYYLSDLMDDIPSAVRAEAASFPLGKSPEPGKKIKISGNDVWNRVAHFKWPSPPLLRDIVLYRSGHLLTQEEIEPLVNEKMQEIQPDSSWKVFLDNDRFQVMEASQPSSPSLLSHFDYDASHHRFSTVLMVYDDEGCPTSYPLKGRILRMIEVPVLKVMKQPGEEIQSSDLTVVKYRWDQLPPNVVLDKNHMIGLTSRGGPLRAYEPLRAPSLGKPCIVKRGQMVSLVLKTPHLYLVQRKAEALEDGVKGQFIKVKNLESQRMVVGQVNEPGTVEIKLE